METQVVQYTATNDKLEAELSSMKELCLKLDRQKDSLLKQLRDNETSKDQVSKNRLTSPLVCIILCNAGIEIITYYFIFRYKKIF